MNALTNIYDDNFGDISLDDIVSELRTQGYNIKSVSSSENTITGISLDYNTLSISTNGTATLTVSYDGGTSENSYYAVINEKYYLMELNDKGVTVSKTATDISGSSNSEASKLTASSSDNCVSIGNINKNKITLNTGSNVGVSTITVSYGSFTDTCTASVLITPTTSSVADASTTFSTEYGTIDVIWLSGTTNTVVKSPNAPVLSGMTPVKWTETEEGWNETPVETTSSDSSWYSYVAGANRTDNTSSKWANAKNTTTGGDSYFVWIPRYAYRITYYSSTTSTVPTGYYDGWGQWRASDGSIRFALDEGAETVDYAGCKYIVHPAFCSGTKYQNGTSKTITYDLGEWSSNISGFWVAKYEMSRTGATSSYQGSGYNTTFISIPNVQSARNISIGNMYTVAKSYDSSKESHLMKNSEWGAVAYLAHSQYGRNGNEININNSSSCITGNGGADTSSSKKDGLVNAFNTTLGAKASTTGNIYGIYDMSGGALEYVAAFNSSDSDGNEPKYGSSFASTSGLSDKYATKYYIGENNSSRNTIVYTYGKIGDATKEVNKGGAYDLTSATQYYNWFSDSPNLCRSMYPFIQRGDSCNDQYYAGIYSSREYSGKAESDSFRTVLCP